MAHSHNKMAGARNRGMSRIPQPTPAFERGAHENQLRRHIHRGGSPSASRCRRSPSARAASSVGNQRTSPNSRRTVSRWQANESGRPHVVHELGRADAGVPPDGGLETRRRHASGWAGFMSGVRCVLTRASAIRRPVPERSEDLRANRLQEHQPCPRNGTLLPSSRVYSEPLRDSLWRDLAESGDLRGAAQRLDHFGCVHALLKHALPTEIKHAGLVRRMVPR